MANNTINSESTAPAMRPEYDPIQMLRDFLKDYHNAPGYLSNYLINRLGDQLIWYDKKSSYFKRKWEKYRKIVIILSASIPFLVGLIGLNIGATPATNDAIDLVVKILVGAAGVIIAVLEGFNSLMKSQELYIDYRVTAEQLKQEFSYFLGKGGDYAGLAGESAFSKLVGNVEVLMANQNNRWAEVTRQKEKAEMSDEIQKAMQSFMDKYKIGPVQPPPPTKPPTGGGTPPPANPPSGENPPAGGGETPPANPPSGENPPPADENANNTDSPLPTNDTEEEAGM